MSPARDLAPGLDCLAPVRVLGVDDSGFILHSEYPAEGVNSLDAYVAFSMRQKTHALADGSRHLVPLGKTYAAGMAQACAVILSCLPVQEKIAQYAIDSMVVRSTADMGLRVQVRIPAWALQNKGR